MRRFSTVLLNYWILAIEDSKGQYGISKLCGRCSLCRNHGKHQTNMIPTTKVLKSKRGNFNLRQTLSCSNYGIYVATCCVCRVFMLLLVVFVVNNTLDKQKIVFLSDGLVIETHGVLLILQLTVVVISPPLATRPPQVWPTQYTFPLTNADLIIQLVHWIFSMELSHRILLATPDS